MTHPSPSCQDATMRLWPTRYKYKCQSSLQGPIMNAAATHTLPLPSGILECRCDGWSCITLFVPWSGFENGGCVLWIHQYRREDTRPRDLCSAGTPGKSASRLCEKGRNILFSYLGCCYFEFLWLTTKPNCCKWWQMVCEDFLWNSSMKLDGLNRIQCADCLADHLVHSRHLTIN